MQLGHVIDSLGRLQREDVIEHSLLTKVDAALLRLIRQEDNLGFVSKVASRNLNHLIKRFSLLRAAHLERVVLVPHDENGSIVPVLVVKDCPGNITFDCLIDDFVHFVEEDLVPLLLRVLVLFDLLVSLLQHRCVVLQV